MEYFVESVSKPFWPQSTRAMRQPTGTLAVYLQVQVVVTFSFPIVAK